MRTLTDLWKKKWHKHISYKQHNILYLEIIWTTNTAQSTSARSTIDSAHWQVLPFWLSIGNLESRQQSNYNHPATTQKSSRREVLRGQTTGHWNSFCNPVGNSLLQCSKQTARAIHTYKAQTGLSKLSFQSSSDTKEGGWKEPKLTRWDHNAVLLNCLFILKNHSFYKNMKQLNTDDNQKCLLSSKSSY